MSGDSPQPDAPEDAALAQSGFLEQRSGPRLSLLLRAAKLIAETGEYLCIIRDISLKGVRLRLFHDVPADGELQLELVNGQRFAIEPKWRDETHAGFTFREPIDVDSFILEPSPFPKRQLRLRMQRQAVLVAGPASGAAMLLDISQSGARIAARLPLALEQRVRLEVEDLPLLYGKVRWRDNGYYGVVFTNTFRLDELAGLAFALQPFAPPAGNARTAASA
ncbi:MAG: PilZ domain-containing protein [Novosphingobium sp.]|nr:PilZ domain-containing protein [Novosphingobium sp.]